MATYRLFTFDDTVPCFMCGADVVRAGDGEIAMFGDGNGNRDATCPDCGYKNIWDVTKSKKKAAEYMASMTSVFDQIRQANARYFAANPGYGKLYEFCKGLIGSTPKKKKKQAGSFSLASSINEEVKKL